MRKIPLGLIRKVTCRQAKGWRLRPVVGLKIELIDGSSYRDMTLVDSQISVLTLLGTQVVNFATERTSIQGHSVGNLEELRMRLEMVLDGDHQALVRTVGADRFENFFKAA